MGNSIKLINFTDPHGQASNPSCRLDYYPSAILEKFRWIGEYAESINCDGVICGGDWIHTPDVSQSFIRELSKIVSKYPCPTFGILGNHDIYGYNPETFLRTSLGIAEGLDMFTRLYIDKPYIITKGNIKVCLTGKDSYFDLDKPENIGDYTRSAYLPDSVNIHTVHGMLVENVWPQVAYCTTLEQVINDNPNADIILSGHEHTGFGIKIFRRSDGRKIIMCNPGSLGRITSSTGDIRKDVRISLITVTEDDYNVELVNLPDSVAKSANEVIDWERIQKEKENKKVLQEFIDNISNTELQGNLNYYDALKHLAEKDEEINEDVIRECISQLEKAETEIKDEEE